MTVLLPTEASKQRIGEAIVKTGNYETPFQIVIPKFEIRKGVVTDKELHRMFKRKPTQAKMREKAVVIPAPAPHRVERQGL